MTIEPEQASQPRPTRSVKQVEYPAVLEFTADAKWVARCYHGNCNFTFSGDGFTLESLGLAMHNHMQLQHGAGRLSPNVV